MIPSNKNNGSHKQEMRLCLINFSCNSTQTSCGHNFFEPRIKSPLYIRIEGVNKGFRTDEIFFSASKYLTLHSSLLLQNSFIIDIGHSSTEETLRIMSDVKDFHDEYDFFVITVVDSPKLLRDSLRTIKKLIEMGVPKCKIKILFSKFDNINVLTEEFDIFLLELKNIKIEYDVNIAIKKSEVYDIMYDMGIYFTDLNKDDLESNKIKIEKLKKKNVTDKEIIFLSKKILVQKVFSTFEPVFDNIFELLFPMPS